MRLKPWTVLTDGKKETTMSSTCTTTHHLACDCREKYFDDLAKKLERAHQALREIGMGHGRAMYRPYDIDLMKKIAREVVDVRRMKISAIEQRMKDPSYCVGAREDISYLISELRNAREAFRHIERELFEKFAAYDADSLTGLNVRAILVIAREALGEG
jgi:hypothetical protein